MILYVLHDIIIMQGGKLILADGWMFKNQEGSHENYIHPAKPGKVTIPFHKKDLTKGTENSIKKQAGLK